MAKARARRPKGADGPAPLFPAPRKDRVRARDVYRDQASTRWFMQHVRQVVGTADLRGTARASSRLPHRPRDLEGLRIAAPQQSRRRTLEDVLRDTDTDAFVVLHDGAVVYEAYFNGMTAEATHLW